MPDFTVGVEEEFFLVDAETPRASAAVVCGARRGSQPARRPGRARAAPVAGRDRYRGVHRPRRDPLRALPAPASLADGAAAIGARLMASGTHPFAHWDDDPGVTPKVAYRRLERDYQQLTREQLVCGCHVHVCVTDPEMAIQIMNRARLWLPVLRRA